MGRGPAYSRLAQSRGQRIEIDFAAEDQFFFGLVDLPRDDRRGAIGDFDFDQLTGEGVDQPRLALGQLENSLERAGRELLAGGILVLAAGQASFRGATYSFGAGRKDRRC